MPTPYPIPNNQPLADVAPTVSTLAQLMQSLAVTQEPQLILHVLPEDGILRHELFTDEEAFVRRLRELLDSGEELSITMNFGYRLNISKPPLRFLVTPWGNIPLFNPLPAAVELEEDGFLGRRYTDLQAPRERPDEDEIDIPQVDTAEDEEEEEEEDEPLTVDEEVDIFTQTPEDP